MLTTTRSWPIRLAAAACAAALLAACSSGDPDDDGTGAGPVDDIQVGDPDDGTAATPQPDVPGVTGAEPADDVPTEVGEAQAPPLLAVIDGWPETTVQVVADDPMTFRVKVADTPERRQQGLMNVPELPDDVGMLFLFDETHAGGFWMKDTLVPLEIAYLRDGEVVAVLQMDPCGDADPCPTYEPGIEYDAALEVNQGLLSDAGVESGTPVSWAPPVEVAS
ncbi:MAG: DUF192 domain-containing protein [Nitriliruptor sp.]|uniref:DUF192 domain-containing protein n=1 Tax=Nitriliruptor sp. TaxID=2448056 RepID=UPI0034A00D4B